jgi:hypothetical protein
VLLLLLLLLLLCMRRCCVCDVLLFLFLLLMCGKVTSAESCTAVDPADSGLCGSLSFIVPNSFATLRVRKRRFFAPFYAKTDQFTKTGSGQT